MRTEVLHIPWNVVTKDYELTESVQRKLRQKISKLECLLGDFPHDAVHLQIALERQPKKPHLSAALTLRVPSNILHSEKTAPDPLSATTRALEGLQRQLKSLKAKLARAPVWKRKQPRAQLHAAKALRFAPTPIASGAGPQTLRDVVADFLQHQYRRLLHHVRRHVRHDELAGEIPKGAIDPRSVVDAVALQVLSAPHQKPGPMS